MTQTHLWKPTLLYPRRAQDKKRIDVFCQQPDTVVVDDVDPQLEELYRIRNPESIRSGVSSEAVAKFVAMTIKPGKFYFGTWVWYPWIHTLIHFLPEAEHTELRTARNRNLITADEQQKYYESRVGIAGLSVGNAIVSSLVHTGGGKYLHLADHDTLSGSNTNRIRAGFDSVGLSKVAVACRETYLVNPYAELAVYEKGLTIENMKDFLRTPKPLDIVVDEMDSLYLKIQLRMYAREYGIPVVMAADNGDGIVVDIERFDLDRKRPLLHGYIPENILRAITPDVSRMEAAKIISTWVGPANISGRMKESLTQIGHTLYTWPQLGNAAFLAGAVMSYVVRLIVTGHPIREGKIVFSPDMSFIPEYVSAKARRKRLQETRKFQQTFGIQ